MRRFDSLPLWLRYKYPTLETVRHGVMKASNLIFMNTDESLTCTWELNCQSFSLKKRGAKKDPAHETTSTFSKAVGKLVDSKPRENRQ